MRQNKTENECTVWDLQTSIIIRIHENNILFIRFSLEHDEILIQVSIVPGSTTSENHFVGRENHFQCKRYNKGNTEYYVMFMPFSQIS